jgi:hypothetical protein
MKEEHEMGFILGFLTGLLAAIGLFVFLAYWLCTRSNHIAIAKAVNGLANALATRPKTSEPSAPGKSAKAAAGSHANAEEERC